MLVVVDLCRRDDVSVNILDTDDMTVESVKVLDMINFVENGGTVLNYKDSLFRGRYVSDIYKRNADLYLLDSYIGKDLSHCFTSNWNTDIIPTRYLKNRLGYKIYGSNKGMSVWFNGYEYDFSYNFKSLVCINDTIIHPIRDYLPFNRYMYAYNVRDFALVNEGVNRFVFYSSGYCEYYLGSYTGFKLASRFNGRNVPKGVFKRK